MKWLNFGKFFIFSKQHIRAFENSLNQSINMHDDKNHDGSVPFLKLSKLQTTKIR